MRVFDALDIFCHINHRATGKSNFLAVARKAADQGPPHSGGGAGDHDNLRIRHSSVETGP